MRTLLGCVVGASFLGAWLSRALGERAWVTLLLCAIALAVCGGLIWIE